MIRTLGYAAVAILLLVLMQPIMAWIRVAGLRLRASGRAELTDPDQLPSELAPMFEEAERQLAVLGFTPAGALWTDSVSTAESRRPSRLFEHDETGAIANVSPPVYHNGRRLFAVSFTSEFRSGHVLMTVDALRHLTPISPPGREWHDHYVNDVVRQWSEHEAAVRERWAADPPVPLHAEDFARLETESLTAVARRGTAEGVLLPAGPEQVRFTTVSAWRYARILSEGAKRVALMERQPARRSAEPAEAWLAAEVYAFLRAESQVKSARTARSKAIVFLASGVLTGIAIGLLLSWRMVPILIAVLLVHELGHLAGMWMFGFRDRQILFLPLIGAAAVGRKDDASTIQRLVVLLLGPVPGIALGFLCLFLARVTGPVWWQQLGFTWLQELGVAAVVLNYLNLLPITPLDGGRIVELLFLQRTPRAGAAFLLCSAAVAGIAGLAFGDFILVGLSVFLLAAAPARWRTGWAVQSARTHVHPGATRTEKVRAAFLALDERMSRVGSAARLQLARAVVEHLDARPAARPLALGGGALYALLLALPIGGALAYLTPRPDVADLCVLAEAQASGEIANPYGQALVEACADRRFRRASRDKQWSRLIQSGREHIARGDTALATEYLRLAYTAATMTFSYDDARTDTTRELLQQVTGN